MSEQINSTSTNPEPEPVDPAIMNSIDSLIGLFTSEYGFRYGADPLVTTLLLPGMMNTLSRSVGDYAKQCDERVTAWVDLTKSAERQQDLAKRICHAAFAPQEVEGVSAEFKAAAARMLNAYQKKVFDLAVGKKINSRLGQAWSLSMRAMLLGAATTIGAAEKRYPSDAFFAAGASVFLIGTAATFAQFLCRNRIDRSIIGRVQNGFDRANGETVHKGFEKTVVSLLSDGQLRGQAFNDRVLGDDLATRIVRQPDVELTVMTAIERRISKSQSVSNSNSPIDSSIAETIAACPERRFWKLVRAPKPAAQTA